MDKLLEEVLAASQKMAVGQGLLLAQSIIRRKLLEAFDRGEDTQQILLEVMKEIVELMEKMENE